MAHIASLDRNEYFFPHPARVQKILLSGSDPNCVSKYCSKNKTLELLTTLSNVIGIEPNFLTMGHGGEDLIIKLLTWFRRISSDFVFLDFSWKTYMDIALGLDYHVHNLLCTKVSSQISTDLSLIHDFLAEQKKPCIIILTSPNNPTGHSLNTADIRQVVQNNPSHIFILDGVYDIPNSLKLELVKTFSNLYFIGSFSKFFGLPGLRVGYCVAQDIPKGFNLALGLPPAAIETTLAALAEVPYYLGNRNIMLNDAIQMQELSNPYLRIFETQAPFFLTEIFPYDDSFTALFDEAAQKHGVKPKIFTYKEKLYLRWGLGPTEINQKIYNYLKFVGDKILMKFSDTTHTQRSGTC